ncbi:MAG TPA: DUF3500 domain-containing protein [Nocardioidaceae bacterium]|nr:DUF3500 domain-containing protein [Nocardioidaceae bacterium]
MRAAATAFLDSLYDGQRIVARYDLADPERHRWQYTPGPRGGLALKDMDPHQRDRALALMSSGLSSSGAETAREIMALEPVLKALEERAGRPGAERRDAEHYWFSVFGDPAREEPWAWRVGGHHLCLHFTVVGGEAAVTPLFFGANPARVPDGPEAGRRVLAAEEDLARELLDALDETQRARAIVSAEAPSDIRTGNAVRAEITAVPTGIRFADLDGGQQALFRVLVDHYLGRVDRPPAVDVESLAFAWAGGTERGQGHYYAVRGSRFLLEYDNTQNGANHIHTVWRDLDRDWGADLLAEHYRRDHS